MKAQILICVGGLTVHRGTDGAIFFPAQENVKEGELSVRLLFHRELYAGVDTAIQVTFRPTQISICAFTPTTPQPTNELL